MKKIFSILAVAITAISLHATEVTHNLELSSITSQGSATWETPTITANAWEGIQCWLESEGVAFDASPYYALVLELEEASSVGVYFDVVYSDGTETNDVTIAAGQTQGELILLSDQVMNIEIKLRDQGSATLKKLYFKGELGGQVKTIPLVTEEHNFPGNFEWSEILDFSKDEFATAHEGDMLIVTYETPLVENAAFRIKTHDANTNVITPNDFTPLSHGKMRFVLTESDLTTIANQSSLYVEGKTIKITGIQLRKRSLLWTGEQVVGEKWQEYQQIDASKLTDLQIGNIICVRVTAIGSTESPRVSLFSGWSNSDALVGGEYYFQGDEAASAENPFIVQFTVTGSMKQQLGNKNLLVRGVNYTMTDVYVLEGEPVVESGVKGYLTVSAAGMATFMLPFNVTSLPTGVKAYNLTNNGDPTIWAEEVTSLTADQPVLIVADAGEYEFVGEGGASADISSKTGTYANGALVGTYTTIDPLAKTTGGNYNYVLNNQGGNVAFYQVRDDGCSVAPYRAYLSCGHDASDNGVNFAPSMRIVFHKDNTTAIEDVQSDKVQSTKVLRNGQLFILRNGVEYNVNGQMTK